MDISDVLTNVFEKIIKNNRMKLKIDLLSILKELGFKISEVLKYDMNPCLKLEFNDKKEITSITYIENS